MSPLSEEAALAALLAGLAPHEARVLGPLARSIGPRLPLGGLHPRPARGEPEGLDGVGLRGPLHRLLPGAFALLDTDPDEFLRRLGADELLYFNLAEADPAAPSALWLFVDAGPDILGGGRVMAAAALLAFAAQAAVAELPLRWRRAQGGPWRSGLEPGWLGLLRQDRCLSPLRAAERDAAHAELETAAIGLLICGPAGRALDDPRLPVLLVGEAEGRLWLEGPTGRVALPTPVGAVEVLAPPPPSSRREAVRRWELAVMPDFFFSPSGARLLAVGHDGLALGFPVDPAGDLHRQVHKKRVTGAVRAMGWLHQKLAVVVQGPDGALRYFDREHDDLPVDAGVLRPGLSMILPHGAARTLIALPPPGTLHPIGLARRRPLRALVPSPKSGASGALLDPGSPVAVGDPLAPVLFISDDRGRALRDGHQRFDVVPGAATELFAWSFTRGPRPRLRYACYPQGPSSGAFFRPPDLGAPIGLLRGSEGGDLAVHMGARGLWTVGPRGEETALCPPGVLSAAVSPDGDCLAWLTGEGVLELYHAPTKRIFARSGLGILP